MKTAYKWNGKEYTDIVLPSGATLGVEDINQNISCAECGRVINFKESYTSKTIHNEIGLGYLICHDCYGEELKGEKYGS